VVTWFDAGGLSSTSAATPESRRFAPIGLMALPVGIVSGRTGAGAACHLRFGVRKRHDRCLSVS
jgi:hypothetical protein